VKTASIRILPSAAAHLPERKCGSVRSVPRGSLVGRRPAHPGLCGAVFGALNRRTWGLKSRPVSITRLQRRTDRSLSGSVPSLMLPRTSQPQVRLLGCGLYSQQSWVLAEVQSIHAILRPSSPSIASRYRTDPTSGRYLVKAATVNPWTGLFGVAELLRARNKISRAA
jgi:hypothetical protein